MQQFITRRGGTPRVAMVFFDEETEDICKELGYELILPPDHLRRFLDSEDHDDPAGERGGGARASRTCWATADSWEELRALAGWSTTSPPTWWCSCRTGTPGKTTFFIRSEEDWDSFAEDIVGQDLKVMKRINNKAAAVEAVITRHGDGGGPVHDRPDRLPRADPVPGPAGAGRTASAVRCRRSTGRRPSSW